MTAARIIPNEELTERFLRRIEIHDACWIWTGPLNRHGYGRFTYAHQTSIAAHRFSYSAFIGPIPEGLSVCHTCDNPPCVNPDHLWSGTQRQNMEDKVRKGRQPRLWGGGLKKSLQTECKRGHPLRGDNVEVHPSTGHRRCKACMLFLEQRRRPRSRKQ